MRAMTIKKYVPVKISDDVGDRIIKKDHNTYNEKHISARIQFRHKPYTCDIGKLINVINNELDENCSTFVEYARALYVD